MSGRRLSQALDALRGHLGPVHGRLGAFRVASGALHGRLGAVRGRLRRLWPATLRRRVALIAAVAVAAVAILAAGVSYVVVRNQLRGQVDDALRAQLGLAMHRPLPLLRHGLLPAPSERKGGPARYAQLVTPSGERIPLGGGVELPVDGRTAWLSRGGDAGPPDPASAHIRDAHVDGQHVRLLASAIPGGGALELARPLAHVDDTLSHLRTVLILLSLAAVALAAALGTFAARGLTAPIARLTRAARHIDETEDLSERIEVRGDGEVAELARRFNSMLDTLERSREAQRQLVADASHELRTPITSLRTNVEVLLEDDSLPPAVRRGVLTDVLAQSEELSALVADVIELARDGEDGDQPREELRLDQLVSASIERARRHAPDVPIEAGLAPALVTGDPGRLARAVNNLLDNAARHTPPGTTVQVRVDTEGVTVRDHGGGVAPDELPYLFDRFYRGIDARARPGSGLGLAIVRQVAEAHGGCAEVENAPGGGALFRLRLPCVAVPAGELSSTPLRSA